MYYDQKIWIGDADGTKVSILPKMANRHGLIAGATGTGKTITLKVLAESFSDAGVPVFLADIKGDLAGMCSPGLNSEDMQKRIKRFHLDECGFSYQSYPSVFWDVYGKMGIPLRTTISEVGPILLSRLLNLNPTQSDILSIVFRIADDEELLLIDIKDLKSMLQYVSENNAEYSAQYGNIARPSIQAILRSVSALESRGADQLFGEPALDISDWFRTEEGRGVINILDCRTLMNDASMYSTFLLWMLSELFETLPEIGDADRPQMVFFFDEAHLLFDGITSVLQDKIEQVVKLIRSKGIGVYFITQSPSDIPDDILSQLGNKIQHALRAYTPKETKALKAAAASFRPNPAFDTAEVLSTLGTGEALISVLDEDGVPGIAQKCKVLPPQSLMGSIPDEEKQAKAAACPLYEAYHDAIDRDSAYEFLQRLYQQLEQDTQAILEENRRQKEAELAEKERLKQEAAAEKERQKLEAAAQREYARKVAALEREAARKAAAQEREEARRAKAAQTAYARQLEKERKAAEKQAKARAASYSKAAGSIGRELGSSFGKKIGGASGKKIGGSIGASLGRNLLGTFLK